MPGPPPSPPSVRRSREQSEHQGDISYDYEPGQDELGDYPPHEPYYDDVGHFYESDMYAEDDQEEDDHLCTYAYEPNDDMLDQSYDDRGLYGSGAFREGAGHREAVEYSPDQGRVKWAAGGTEYDAWSSGGAGMYYQPPPPPPPPTNGPPVKNRGGASALRQTPSRQLPLRGESQQQDQGHQRGRGTDEGDDEGSLRAYFSSAVIGASATTGGADIYAFSGGGDAGNWQGGVNIPVEPYRPSVSYARDEHGEGMQRASSGPSRPAPAAPPSSALRKREVDLL
jgi:hypothetical protein